MTDHWNPHPNDRSGAAYIAKRDSETLTVEAHRGSLMVQIGPRDVAIPIPIVEKILEAHEREQSRLTRLREVASVLFQEAKHPYSAPEVAIEKIMTILAREAPSLVPHTVDDEEVIPF